MVRLTPEDRAFLTSHLVRTRDLLVSEVASLQPSQWNFRPDEESWSIAECADHIVAIENRMLKLVSKRMQEAPPDLERAAQVQRKTQLLLQQVPSRETRVKVPAGIETHTHSGTPQEFLRLFEERRAAVQKYVDETQDTMHDRVSPHPVFNDLDGCQWLLMIALHSERHAAQIAEVKTHPDYPR